MELSLPTAKEQQSWPTSSKRGYASGKPCGGHARIEARILAAIAIGDKQVQWMRSHLTPQQAVEANLPAWYVSGNAETDLSAGRAIQE
eukprot:863398-Amphidinium_carterae.4